MIEKKNDIIVLVFLVVLASSYIFISAPYWQKIPKFSAIIMFFMPSILYLSIRKKKDWRKIFAGVFTIGFVVGFTFCLIAEHTKAWDITTVTDENKVFEVLAYQTVLGIMLMVMLIITFYQHFFINNLKDINGLPHRYYKVTISLTFLSVILCLVYWYKPSFFSVNLSYLKIGLVNLLVPVIFLFRNPQFFKKVLLPIPYFFTLFLVFDIVAMKLGGWVFDGSYIQKIDFFGEKLPIEEVIYFMIFFAPAVISCYESFINHKKG